MTYQMRWVVDAEYLTPSFFKVDTDAVASTKLHHLNQAAALYLASCLDRFSSTDLVTGHYHHLFNWMNRFSDSEEIRSLIDGIAESDRQNILELVRKYDVEGETLCRVGEKLPKILTGKIDPLALMLEDGFLYRLYANDDASKRCYCHMIHYLQQATKKNPNMNILELGAGTSGATVPLLQELGSDGVLPIYQYDFTDVSTGFFERSSIKLQKWSKYLRFKRFDLQGDPAKQGFAEGSYDIIIASNVLHATDCIDVSLSKVRKLLKPGGKLLLIEVTRVLPFYNVCSGVLPGWWAGVNDGRTDAPLLSIEQWDNALRRAGFSGVSIAAKDYVGPAQRSAMLISKAIVHEQAASQVPPVRILVSPSLAVERLPEFPSRLKTALSEEGLDVSTEYLNSQNTNISVDTLYILLDDGTSPILKAGSPELFEIVKSLCINATRVLWVTAQEDASAALNPEKGMIQGFARVARGENHQLQLLTLDIQESIAGPGYAEIVRKINDVVLTSFYGPHAMRSNELEYIYRVGQLYVPRLIPDGELNRHIQHSDGELCIKPQPFHQGVRPLKLKLPDSGSLEDLHFVDDKSLQESLSDNELEVQVAAYGVNFKDVAIALNQVKRPLPMAGEYAGTVLKVPPALKSKFQVGDRVSGFGSTAYASQIRVNAFATCRIPDSMSFVTAAAIPVAFSAAHFSLVDITRLKRGQTILIHSAAGAVGQAALRIAQHIGAKIFATVGTESKQHLLMDKYDIPHDHIFSSHTGGFKKGILHLTDNKGVDVVLNSLSGQLLQESWECVAEFGTFIELGKPASQSRSAVLPMAPFDRQVTFASVDLSRMCISRPEEVGKLLGQVMDMLTGVDAPIDPINIMPIGKIEEAFRHMQSREHIGKIVLQADPNYAMVRAVSEPSTNDRLQLKENATYMIAGGTGGLGIKITHYMIARGARHIVLFSRKGLDMVKVKDLQDEFSGAQVEVLAADVTDDLMIRKIVENCTRAGRPIRGVIQATMVLQNRVISHMTWEEFQDAIQPKVTGTQNLVKALQGHALDFFLMLSSGASIIGNLSQSNYAAGNAFMDALATNKALSSHSPFITLNLGPVTDAGTIADSNHHKKVLIRQGYILSGMRELVAMINYSLRQNTKCCGNGSRTNQHDAAVVQNTKAAIAAADTVEKMHSIISGAIAEKISTLTAQVFESIDMQCDIKEFGLDSLVVIELRNWIQHKFQATLQASEISNAAHIIALALTVSSRSELVRKSLSSHYDNVEQE
ncbi:hypothetical protein AJ79_08295 [Helicocarpus griseus UAMH5409]|uniref:Carrier domain-containing protein n=1 Tax=Helicocarpus griseus UAMH5409 TaxID=1447875 RepID=A0A2B7WUB8_9EURO|nr:hypothetical protein AJ79_08295 [Helicocarpus griseus UAMH5409]